MQSEAGNPPVRDTQKMKGRCLSGREPSYPKADRYEPHQGICLFCLPQQSAYRNPTHHYGKQKLFQSSITIHVIIAEDLSHCKNYVEQIQEYEHFTNNSERFFCLKIQKENPDLLRIMEEMFDSQRQFRQSENRKIQACRAKSAPSIVLLKKK